MNDNKIAVIGVGYVGLPLLEAFSTNKSNEIKGYDISKDRLNNIRHRFAKSNTHLFLTSNIEDIASSNIYS